MNSDTYLIITYLEFLNRIYDRELFLSKALNNDFDNGKPIVTYLPILRMDNNLAKLGSGFDISENKHLICFDFDRPKEEAMKLVISILKRNYEPHPKFSYEELALQLLILASNNLKNDIKKTRDKNVSDTWLINDDKIIFINLELTDNQRTISGRRVSRHRDLIYSLLSGNMIKFYHKDMGGYCVFDTDFSKEIENAMIFSNRLIYDKVIEMENKFFLFGLTKEKLRKEFRFICHTSRVDDYDKSLTNNLTKNGFYSSLFW